MKTHETKVFKSASILNFLGEAGETGPQPGRDRLVPDLQPKSQNLGLPG